MSSAIVSTRRSGRLVVAACSRRDDPKVVGGTLWTDLDALMRARYLEVFLNPGEGRYVVAARQSRIVDAPTDTPTFAR